MRIAIITDETEGQPLGGGTYILNLVENLLNTDRKNEYTLVHRKKESREIYSRANELIIPYNARFPLSTARNFITLPMQLRKHNFDIVHHPVNIGPFAFKAIWPTKTGRCIQTVYDIIPLMFKDTHEKAVRLAFRHLFPRVARNVDHIITISEATKQDIIRKIGTAPEKITPIHLAANKIYKPQKNPGWVKKKYGINHDYILFVSALEPKKNIPTLIKAYSELRKKGHRHKLVLAGKKGWSHAEITEQIKKNRLQEDVILPGYIPLEDMPSLYSAASAFCLPSLYEGFGIPALESMSCGTPVITSNRGSLPEIVGKAGITTNPMDYKTMAERISEVLTDKKLAADMKAKGLEQAARFSWEKTAMQTIKTYEAQHRH